ncbi:unnamed protein product [Amoebophrya sp. A120]|nr:unnamed protein product [Amoebophrya sp. A120]|eukprot:GSA120T00020446001.1
MNLLEDFEEVYAKEQRVSQPEPHPIPGDEVEAASQLDSYPILDIELEEPRTALPAKEERLGLELLSDDKQGVEGRRSFNGRRSEQHQSFLTSKNSSALAPTPSADKQHLTRSSSWRQTLTPSDFATQNKNLSNRNTTLSPASEISCASSCVTTPKTDHFSVAGGGSGSASSLPVARNSASTPTVLGGSGSSGSNENKNKLSVKLRSSTTSSREAGPACGPPTTPGALGELRHLEESEHQEGRSSSSSITSLFEDPRQARTSTQSQKKNSEWINPLYDKSRLRPVKRKDLTLQPQPRKRTTRAYGQSSSSTSNANLSCSTPTPTEGTRDEQGEQGANESAHGTNRDVADHPEQGKTGSADHGKADERRGSCKISSSSAAVVQQPDAALLEFDRFAKWRSSGRSKKNSQNVLSSGCTSASSSKSSVVVGGGVAVGASASGLLAASTSTSTSSSSSVVYNPARETTQLNNFNFLQTPAASRVKLSSSSSSGYGRTSGRNTVQNQQSGSSGSNTQPWNNTKPNKPTSANIGTTGASKLALPGNNNNTSSNTTSRDRSTTTRPSSAKPRVSLTNWYTQESEESGKARKTSIALPVTPIALSDQDKDSPCVELDHVELVANGISEETQHVVGPSAVASSTKRLSEWYNEGCEGEDDDNADNFHHGTSSLSGEEARTTVPRPSGVLHGVPGGERGQRVTSSLEADAPLHGTSRESSGELMSANKGKNKQKENTSEDAPAGVDEETIVKTLAPGVQHFRMDISSCATVTDED